MSKDGQKCDQIGVEKTCLKTTISLPPMIGCIFRHHVKFTSINEQVLVGANVIPNFGWSGQKLTIGSATQQVQIAKVCKVAINTKPQEQGLLICFFVETGPC